MFKVTLVLLFAFVVTQGLHVGVQEEQLDNVIDDIEKLLSELKEAVEKVVTEVEDLLRKLEQKVQDIADVVINTAKDAIDREVQVILDKMVELINTAGATNVAACVNQTEPQIKAIPDVLIDNLTGCVTGKINEAKQIIKTATDKITNVVNEVTNIEQEIEDCGTGAQAAVCLTELVAKITRDIVELPADIKNAYQEAEDLINNLLPSIETCAKEQVDKVPEQGKAILADLRKCLGL